MKEIQRIYKIIGDKIAKERVKRNMTQLEFSRFLLPEVKLGRTSITHLENGNMRIMLHDLIGIFEKLDMQLDFKLS